MMFDKMVTNKSLRCNTKLRFISFSLVFYTCKNNSNNKETDKKCQTCLQSFLCPHYVPADNLCSIRNVKCDFAAYCLLWGHEQPLTTFVWRHRPRFLSFHQPKMNNNTGCYFYYLLIVNGCSSEMIHIWLYVCKAKIRLKGSGFFNLWKFVYIFRYLFAIFKKSAATQNRFSLLNFFCPILRAKMRFLVKFRIPKLFKWLFLKAPRSWKLLFQMILLSQKFIILGFD